MDQFEDMQITHSIQTNATLIDEKWVDFLVARSVRVGLSIDGPVADNAHRADWSGRPAFDSVLRGLRLLVDAGQEIAIIAVVSDPNPMRARRLYHFAKDLGVVWLGINIEEREGVNVRRTAPAAVDITGFWSELLELWKKDSAVRVREIDRVIGYANEVLSNRFSETVRLDPLPTVAWNGDVTLISPELAGFSSERLGNFCCGNILSASLDQLISEGLQKNWVEEFGIGIDRCRMSCEYTLISAGVVKLEIATLKKAGWMVPRPIIVVTVRWRLLKE